LVGVSVAGVQSKLNQPSGSFSAKAAAIEPHLVHRGSTANKPSGEPELAPLPRTLFTLQRVRAPGPCDDKLKLELQRSPRWSEAFRRLKKNRA